MTLKHGIQMGKFLHCDWLGVGQFIVIFQIFSVL